MLHQRTVAYWQHQHHFSGHNSRAEKMTFIVLLLTTVTMIVEIIAGSIFGSMALLADGWHMATHVAAFMITLYAYRYARRYRDNAKYSFGTGKVSVLGGFASAVALSVVALVMLTESMFRFFNPHVIQFNQAIVVAVIGLMVNLLSAILLKEHHHHEHGHDHHDHDHHHAHDHNLRAAYMHVIADALTSLLAIAALLTGKWLNWLWMDPMMGIVGAAIISRWSFGLIKQTSPILLDASIELATQELIQKAIEVDADNQVTDIHIWQLGSEKYAAIISLVTHHPQSSEHYKKLLAGFRQLVHVTIEVNKCQDEECFSQE